MRLIAIRLAASSVLPCLALAVAAAGPLPVPPVKPGLWEVRMSVLDADGHEVAAPEQAALSRMPPEARARMAEAMNQLTRLLQHLNEKSSCTPKIQPKELLAL